MRLLLLGFLAVIGAFLLSSWHRSQRDDGKTLEHTDSSSSTSSSQGIPIFTFRVVNSYPHDPKAFTQGLAFSEGFLYEGTGLRGHSSLRKVELETGVVLEERILPPSYFGEGITCFENTIIQLTWRSNIGLIYDRNSFDLLNEFRYSSEGWGITSDGSRLIMSDGSSTLRVLDPITFRNMGSIEVSHSHGLLKGLNELEYVHGGILANVWPTDIIARISPETGRVSGWINLRGLLDPQDRFDGVDVLNGIAYDRKRDRLFVTGKLWPKLFEIELIPTS